MPPLGDPQKLQAAFSLHQAGKLDQAADLYRQIINRDDRNFPALHYLGLIEASRGNHEHARTLLERSLASEPPNLPFLENYATILFQGGDYEAALQACQRGLKLNPSNVALLYVAAISLFKLARFEDALAQFDRLLRLEPNHVAAMNERGGVLAELKQYDAALGSFENVLKLEPRYAAAYLARGNVYGALERHGEAIAAYDSALALNPDMAEAWLGRGNVFRGLRHYDAARVALMKAVSLQPNSAEMWLGSGNVAFALSRLDEALAAYDRSLALRPNLAEAFIGRGNVLIGFKRFDAALIAIDQGLSLKPDSAEGWHARGRVFYEINRIAEAIDNYEKALRIKPDFSDALSNRIFALDFLAESDFATQQEARRQWWQKIGAPIAERSQPSHRNALDPDRRIKVGYVSSDFRWHSAARCFRPMLRFHDKAGFQVTCYSSSAVEDDVTREFQELSDRWRNASQLSDDELCRLIQEDEIDILVDLAGHTAGNRLPVFARRAAPVQVSAGATGTGMPMVDYLFSDSVVCPPSVRHLFAEKICDLPSIMTIEPLPYQIPISKPPVLSKGYITFGVFNRVSKISDDAVSLWARILHGVPDAKLLIKGTALDEAPMQARQLERFAAHGIAAGRIGFLGATSHQDHLAAFKDVDISLDPFPQNGGISALESLQMGVPLVALLGNGISSRAAGSILNSVGMNDWVAANAEDYLAIARKFASMPDYLEDLRPKLPRQVAQSAVGDGAIYTKAIETAYRAIWIEYCQTARR